jgi:hypothetical protein
MSRLIGYIIVAGISASPLRGQDIAQMQRRVDSTFRAAVIAQKAVLDYRAAHPPLLNFSDSIIAHGGRIKVYFDSRLAEQARAGFSEADKYLSELGQALERAEPTVFSITSDSQFNQYGRRQAMNLQQHFAAYPNNPSKTSVDGDPESIAYAMVRSVSAAISAKSASGISQWTNGAIPIAPGLDEKVEWATLRLGLVSSPSHLGRSCYLGDVRACRVFLGLDTVADPVHELYDTLGRQRRVSHVVGGARLYSRVATERCLGGNDDACVSVLQGLGGDIAVLSNPYMRTSVVAHALRLGGERAAERLLTTPGGPREALAAAAKMPLDSLIADWQRHLGEGSTSGNNVPFTMALSAIGWVALCVFLALRGSRWR